MICSSLIGKLEYSQNDVLLKKLVLLIGNVLFYFPFRTCVVEQLNDLSGVWVCLFSIDLRMLFLYCLLISFFLFYLAGLSLLCVLSHTHTYESSSFRLKSTQNQHIHNIDSTSLML